MNNLNNVNPAALLRSLIIYAICVPLAIVVGYTLVNLTNANFQDMSSLGVIGVLVGILVFPLLMKWHYPLLIFSWALPATLFFIPGRPSLFLFMVVVSLTISVIERILDRNRPFLPTGGVHWPLLAMLAVIFVTAKLTGGFGLRSMGSDVYGGKKYVFMIIGILSFFAITARPIPKEQVNLYVSLYFLGGIFNVISDLYAYTPGPLQYIYLIFPPSAQEMDPMGNLDLEWGKTRLAGIAMAAGTAFYWMLARHGFRKNFLTGKLWRPLLLVVLGVLMLLGGFRSSIVSLAIVIGLIFYLEKLHRTGAMLAVLLIGITGAALLVPMARYLPFTFQRALAFLPLDISADARLNAEASTQWRLDMWQALLPEIPQYLLVGKGFSFSAETFNDYMGKTATFHNILDAADDPLALSSDFHSGPLSLIIPFGIWGIIAWLWYWLAGFFVVWRNYRYGDPDLRHINLFLFASFISKCFGFVFIFGSVVEDVAGFAAVIGLSIALNHGVKSHVSVKSRMAAAPAPAIGNQILPARPALPVPGR